MTRSILRVVLTTLALVILFAGSFNLNRTAASASEAAIDEGATTIAPAPSKCSDLCGCPGGAYLCCTIWLADGTKVNCGMP
jgi:hypothetical protein